MKLKNPSLVTQIQPLKQENHREIHLDSTLKKIEKNLTLGELKTI